MEKRGVTNMNKIKDCDHLKNCSACAEKFLMAIQKIGGSIAITLTQVLFEESFEKSKDKKEV